MKFFGWFIACTAYIIGIALLHVWVPQPYGRLVTLLYCISLPVLLGWYKKTRS